MVDTTNTQQARNAHQGNGRVSEPEPHCIHLVEASRELLAECHRHRRYLTVCGELLELSKLPSSDCEGGCERAITYCQDCLHAAVKYNADAGLVWTPPAGSVLLDSWPAS